MIQVVFEKSGILSTPIDMKGKSRQKNNAIKLLTNNKMSSPPTISFGYGPLWMIAVAVVIGVILAIVFHQKPSVSTPGIPVNIGVGAQFGQKKKGPILKDARADFVPESGSWLIRFEQTQDLTGDAQFIWRISPPDTRDGAPLVSGYEAAYIGCHEIQLPAVPGVCGVFDLFSGNEQVHLRLKLQGPSEALLSRASEARLFRRSDGSLVWTMPLPPGYDFWNTIEADPRFSRMYIDGHPLPPMIDYRSEILHSPQAFTIIWWGREEELAQGQEVEVVMSLRESRSGNRLPDVRSKAPTARPPGPPAIQ